MVCSFFGPHFRIKTRDKERRFDLSEIIFKLKKVIKLFAYMSKIKK